MKPVLIKQKAGLGDILFIQKIAEHYKQRGHRIIWPVVPAYSYLKEYIENCEYVNVDDSFDFKQQYENCPRCHIMDSDDCIIVCTDGCSHNDLGVMRSKYKLVDLDYTDWVEYIKINRNLEREEALFNKLNISKNTDYIFINRQFGTPPNDCAVNIFFRRPENLPVIELEYIDGVRVFDWMGIIEKAKEIHTVDTCFSYIMAAMKLENVNLYPRLKQNDNEVNLNYCSDFYSKTWKFGSNS